MVSRLSIMGMYLYDNTMFDNFQAPSVKAEIFGVNQSLVNNVLSFDTSLFFSRLLMECESMSCIYPNPATLKQMVEIWSKTYNYNWCRMLTTAALKYVPIWNVDASVENVETTEGEQDSTETHTKTTTHGGTDTTAYGKTRNETETNAGSDVQQYNNTKTRTDNLIQKVEPGSEDIEYYNQTAADRTETVTTSVAAYNDASLQTKEQVSTVHPTKVTRHTSFGDGDKTTNTGTQADAHTGSDTLTHGHTITTAETNGGNDRLTYGHTITESDSIAHSNDESSSKSVSETRTGNIGVTTTQQMIKQEWEIDVFNIYDVLIESFKEHFCIMVY